MCAELTRRGWDVTGIDLRSRDPIDCRDFFAVYTGTFDLVVHCAAHVGGRSDIENKAAYIGAYNVQLDGALFEWCLQSRPEHVIYWSSSAAYPTELQDELRHPPVPLIEIDVDVLYPDPADQTYGWAKLVGERLAYEYAQEGGRVNVFRPFSGWADDQDTSYPMGAFLDRARRKADPFQIWGPGTQVRDFIHMDDVIGAAMTAVDQDYPHPLNLCTGVPTSFTELARALTKLAGYQPELEFLLDKPTGVAYRVGDPTEMGKVWTCSRTLTESLSQTVDSWR
jgi:nucleoside-diphosphate-sugar epimerase